MADEIKVLRSKGHKKPIVRMLADVEEEEIHWLWYPYIPAAMVTMIEGDPGLGKSYITCAIAAAVSAGKCLPGQTKCLSPQKVLMLSAEDSLGNTVKKRIRGLGGNFDNIYVSDDYFSLDKLGLFDLEEMMKTTAATIVFLDPIVAYMGNKIDMNKANEVRGLMGPLTELARKTGTAIVVVRHLRKGAANEKGKRIYRGIGSIDFTAAVRSVLQVEEKNGHTFITHAKHNLTEEGKMLKYAIRNKLFYWEGVLNNISDLRPVLRESTPLIREIQDKLRNLLAGGPKPAQEMLAALSDYKRKAILDAKKSLVKSTKQGSGGWMWELLPERSEGGDEGALVEMIPDAPAEPAGAAERPGDSVTLPVASDAPAVAPRRVATPSSDDPASAASVESGVTLGELASLGKTPSSRPVTAPPDLTLPDFLDRALAAAKARIRTASPKAI